MRRFFRQRTVEPVDPDLSETALELSADPMLLNMGPAHPLTHGTGQMLSDVVPCFGSINMVGGECDH